MEMRTQTDRFIRYTEFIVLDLETNGLNPYKNSVMSCAAIRCRAEVYEDIAVFRKTDSFERYYYPVEQYNPSAVRVNCLTDDRIKELRETADYPEYFRDDDGLAEFCSGVRRFVAHNIYADMQFLNFRPPAAFCTMRVNSGILKYKTNPSLVETANYYEISFDRRKLHTSVYDAYVTMKVFEVMVSERNPKALEFLS